MELGTGFRRLSGVVGALFLGLGAAAAFVGKGDAADLGLLATGAIFFFVAITGYAPSRLKIGETELHFVQKLRTTRRKVISAAGIGDSEGIQDAIASLGEAVESAVLTPVEGGYAWPTDAATYEAEALASLDRAAQGVSDVVVYASDTSQAQGLDAVIDAGDVAVGVVIKFSTTKHRDAVWKAVSRTDRTQIQGILVVTTPVMAPRALEAAESEFPVEVVTWLPSSGGDMLASAVDRVLERARKYHILSRPALESEGSLGS